MFAFFFIEFVYIFVLGYPPCGCGSLHNSEDVEGQIVLLERGECSFTSKALKAQEAGAAAAIITVSQLFVYFSVCNFLFTFFQEQNPDNDDLYISMVDDTTGRDVIIPTAFLLGKNGYVAWGVWTEPAMSLKLHHFQSAWFWICSKFNLQTYFGSALTSICKLG